MESINAVNIINSLYDITNLTNDALSIDVSTVDAYTDNLPSLISKIKLIEEKLNFAAYSLKGFDRDVILFLQRMSHIKEDLLTSLSVRDNITPDIITPVNDENAKLSLIAINGYDLNVDTIDDLSQYSCNSILQKLLNTDTEIEAINQYRITKLPTLIVNLTDQLKSYRVYRDDVQKEDCMPEIQKFDEGAQTTVFNNSHPLNTFNIDYIRKTVNTLFNACLALDSNFILFQKAADINIQNRVNVPLISPASESTFEIY